MGAITTRLPDGLKEEGESYAGGLGISLNALLAVALREYLDARQAMPRSGAPSSALPPAARSPALAEPPPPVLAPLAAPERAFPAPKSRADPCPCGAVDGNGYRLKWKHCHGRTG